MFGNNDPLNCPINSCHLMEQGCESVLNTKDISLSGTHPFNLYISQTNTRGYSHSICLSCSNGIETKFLDNWHISQCGKLSPGKLETYYLDHEKDDVLEQIEIDVEKVFSNPDTRCPISDCTFHLAGDCLGPGFTAPDLLIPETAPWVI